MGDTTSAPSWPAAQFLMARLPEIKSFWTKPVCVYLYNVHSYSYLDVHHHDGGLGLDNLGDPSVPAVDELLHAHRPVTRRVEDHEQVANLLTVKMIRLS